MNSFRLAVAGIIQHNNKVLLVRYKDKHGSSFLVGPGGGVNHEEDLVTALRREVMEETGIDVTPSKLLFVEDLLTNNYRMTKIWFLCTVNNDTIIKTAEADIEGIIDASWYIQEQLAGETVYPEMLKNVDWNILADESFQAQYIPLRKAIF